MKKILKKIFGITEMEEALVAAQKQIEQAEETVAKAKAAAEEAVKQEELAKLTP